MIDKQNEIDLKKSVILRTVILREEDTIHTLHSYLF